MSTHQYFVYASYHAVSIRNIHLMVLKQLISCRPPSSPFLHCTISWRFPSSEAHELRSRRLTRFISTSSLHRIMATSRLSSSQTHLSLTITLTLTSQPQTHIPTQQTQFSKLMIFTNPIIYYLTDQPTDQQCTAN